VLWYFVKTKEVQEVAKRKGYTLLFQDVGQNGGSAPPVGRETRRSPAGGKCVPSSFYGGSVYRSHTVRRWVPNGYCTAVMGCVFFTVKIEVCEEAYFRRDTSQNDGVSRMCVSIKVVSGSLGNE